MARGLPTTEGYKDNIDTCVYSSLRGRQLKWLPKGEELTKWGQRARGLSVRFNKEGKPDTHNKDEC